MYRVPDISQDKKLRRGHDECCELSTFGNETTYITLHNVVLKPYDRERLVSEGPESSKQNRVGVLKSELI